MTNTRNILLTDDSPIILENLKSIFSDLENIGIIDWAENVEDAKNILTEGETDIAVFDIQLPDGTGFELLKWVKSLFPQIIVIMFSNNAEEIYREIAKEYGADYFFDKSTQIEELIDTVSSFK